MEKNLFTDKIARELGLAAQGVDNTIALLDEGCTIPFISRYRKERTGNMDEVQIAHIAEMLAKLKELAKRKETILKSIDDQGKLTDELKKRIDATWESSELEDIYLPYKPKRRTRAQIARELGLEPLAMMIMLNQVRDVEGSALRFVKGDVKSVDDAIKGAEDIIAEMVSEDERVRQNVRSVYRREATITSKVVAKMKDDEKAQKYSDYFDWSEPLKRCTSHRLLAMRRGENEGILRVTIAADDEECTNRIKRNYQYNKYINEAIDDAFKRLIKPSMETEFAGLSKEKADEEAIHVFTENLRQLLLAAPLGQKRVLGVDPGIRTGCKIVCIDAQGNLLHHEVAHIANQRDTAERQLVKLVNDYKLEAIAIGNGTYSREASDFIHGLHFDHEVQIFVVSEDGASVYSASETAREEFPDQDVTVRGAVSIARRLMDPLAELVKIDPKSIGVGQYQHDVDQSALKKSLDTTVELCVNSVGVNLNTASKHLLTYVSGLGPALAQNIVNYRKENGAFTSRAQLKKVPRLGPSAYEQCAGFLRIPEAKNPLDNSAVHPESYKVVEQMAKDCGCKVIDLMKNADLRKKIDIRRYVTDSVGMPTLLDIMKELEKPGLDPRDKIEVFEFDKNVHTPEDLIPGMELPGIVTNITNFGAFVDVGVHQDGLVHISQLADKYISDPAEVVKLHQHVRVKVLEVDLRRHRISLTMKGL
ncbi:RNA-binding transcriptional accessory protein [Segatella bryantii]|uniref:Tex family protein n=1 Tax=Segatella bryantii TaxID=77095 RepID=UPI001EDC7988|nr:Tex family protein [Segatella bryantii]UKK75749.1 RNA-binding transcriptional accessory protein [Segatella bryantii]